MNTVLDAPATRNTAVDLLFSGHSQMTDTPALQETRTEMRASVVPPTPDLDIKKLSIDLNHTQRQSPYAFRGNESLFNVNLLTRVLKSGAALWRNPVRTLVRRWGRREVMHVFNGLFHQSITDYEKYETFGRCYTCPDPFRNDDPPWTPVFC